jgi:hypothetical protein
MIFIREQTMKSPENSFSENTFSIKFFLTLLLLSTSSLFALGYEVKQGIISYKEITQRGEVKNRHFWKENGLIQATESNVPLLDGSLKRTVHIINTPHQISHTIHHNMKSYVTETGENAATPQFYTSNRLSHLQKIPSQTICEKKAEGYTDGKGFTIYLWKGLLLKQIENGKVTREAVKISLAKPRDSYFTIPNGYTTINN